MKSCLCFTFKTVERAECNAVYVLITVVIYIQHCSKNPKQKHCNK